MTRDARGFTLTELLVTMVVLSFVMGTAVAFFRSQNQSFQRTSTDLEMLANQRFALGTVERTLRTLGSNVTGDQPMLVYGAADVVAFNADYVERDSAPVRWAVNFNPDAPVEEVTAWEASAAGLIPNQASYTYPSETYRLRDGQVSPAETIIFYLEADGATARADDYVLYERVNAAAPQVVARNILPYPGGRAFFEYLLRDGTTGLRTADDELPLIRRSLLGAASAADTAARLRPDSVRAIRFSFRVTNGESGAGERTRDVSTIVELPNNGLPQPTVCGRRPDPPATFAATPGASGSGDVTLDWTRSDDHGGGEQDVLQYLVYQRDDTATVWRDPLFTVRADTTTAYAVTISGLTPGNAYRFGLAAQDCTPQSSTISDRLVTVTP